MRLGVDVVNGTRILPKGERFGPLAEGRGEEREKGEILCNVQTYIRVHGSAWEFGLISSLIETASSGCT